MILNSAHAVYKHHADAWSGRYRDSARPKQFAGNLLDSAAGGTPRRGTGTSPEDAMWSLVSKPNSEADLDFIEQIACSPMMRLPGLRFSSCGEIAGMEGIMKHFSCSSPQRVSLHLLSAPTYRISNTRLDRRRRNASSAGFVQRSSYGD